jgi:hypothetical protein
MLFIIVEFGLFCNLFFFISFSVFSQLLPPILVLFREEIGHGSFDRAYRSHLVVRPALANTVRTTTASHDQKVYGMPKWNRVLSDQIAPRGQRIRSAIISTAKRRLEAIFIFIVLLYYKVAGGLARLLSPYKSTSGVVL